MRPLGLVLMTALPPTEGHVSLCSFASDYMSAVGGDVVVLMCVLPDEPPGRALHRTCLEEALEAAGHKGTRVELQFSNDPQSPSGPDDDAFWSHWVRTIMRQTRATVTHVFSSEDYGARLASSFGAQHVPFDRGRVITSVRATDVRADLVGSFHTLVAPLRRRLTTTVTIFGQESVGKTTIARALAEATGSVWSPEWARQYLESLPTPETTLERMGVIARGQWAQERAALRAAHTQSCPFAFMDTDLLSTIGYLELYWGGSPAQPRQREWHELRAKLDELFQPSDLYLIMSDEDVPFTPDPLRYGGDRRETTENYWIALLQRYSCPYAVVRGTVQERLETSLALSRTMLESRAGFVGYERRR